ncbi:MAG: pyridine nucleotide-disulfide oxidoreductase [Pseudonocardiales bacterium]|nr:MAG: pyridine nucleotide-disulfide oxidoreductase [Pseudonocardiales bacterium]
MAAEKTYDVVVIGAGSTGENVAERSVRGGLTAALVEAELVGGECSYWACMPSKALLRGPEVVGAARAVKGAAAAVTGELGVAATLERRNGFTSNWDDASQVKWATGKNIDVVRGRGRLDGEKTVRVEVENGGDLVLHANHAVVVCTGSQASLPPVDGLADARPWTAREATSAKEIPGRLAVLGGGVVGCEMATAYSALGATVTLIEVLPSLLAANEPFAGEAVAAALRDAGVDVRIGAEVSRVSRAGDGSTTLHLADGAVTADALLVAAGRRAGLDSLGLDSVGIAPQKWLPVDDTGAVDGLDWLYAAGDVTGRALLTHMGKYAARACGDAIVARARGESVDPHAVWSPYTATADHHAVPAVTFTDPQVASVGRTEKAARDEGLAIRTVEYDLGNIAGAAVRADGYAGKAKLVIDDGRDVILGATFVGPDVGELLHAATIAVVGEVPLDRLWHAVPSYPTVSEVWLRLLESDGR